MSYETKADAVLSGGSKRAIAMIMHARRYRGNPVPLRCP